MLALGSLALPPVRGQQPTEAVVHLTDGGFLPGQLLDTDEPGALPWRSQLFSRPIVLFASAVASVEFPKTEATAPQEGYCLELNNGDVLYGRLRGLDEAIVQLDCPELGLLHIARGRARRLARVGKSGELVFLGPRGLDDWESPPDAGQNKAGWREDGGFLVADSPGAALASRFDVPEAFSIEFELSWTQRCDFAWELGVQRRGKKQPAALRLEVWDDALVAVAEDDEEADVAYLTPVASQGRMILRAYVDQSRHRLLVFSLSGEMLGQVQLSSPGEPQPMLRLTHGKGTMRLEQLRVARWNGEAPSEATADRGRVQTTSGVQYGGARRFDADLQQFEVGEGDAAATVPAEQIESVIFPAEKFHLAGVCQVTLHNRGRLSGTLRKVANATLMLDCPGFEDPVAIPLSGVNTLRLPAGEDPLPVLPEGRQARLQAAHVRLQGALVTADETGSSDPNVTNGESCLFWHARGARNSSPLMIATAARITYREPTLPIKPAVRQGVPMRNGAQGVLGRLFSAFSNPPKLSKSDRSLHLRVGDTIVCEAQRIDEQGVTFTSPTTDQTFVPHDQIKALELEDLLAGITLDDAKRSRLLTLPRMQRDNPPTHLILSTGGDYLRARLLAMDSDTLTVEVRLEVRRIPRKSVARIIWLHEDELPALGGKVRGEASSSVNNGSPGDAGSSLSADSQGIRVQAVRNSGSRLTFRATGLAEGKLSGLSEVLGPCRVALDEVDQLYVGAEIEAAAADLAYHQWKLRQATEPKYVTMDDGQVARVSGTESPMVGQPAPDFQLELLDGKAFRLSDRKGKIVVLDFWASWCGPCIRAMPKVTSVVAEFEGDGVELVAVNLQEDPQSIRAALERLQLNATVALDIDGVAAARYAATAIPQTVIIDRRGVVARLFVGGASNFEDQLREALQSVLSEEGPP